MADQLTTGKTWRETDAQVRGVGRRMKAIKSGQDVGSKGAGWKGVSEFTVDSEVRSEQGSAVAQYSLSQISGAPGGKSDTASER